MTPCITAKDFLPGLNVISTLNTNMPTLIYKPTISAKLSELIEKKVSMGITYKPKDRSFVVDLYRENDDGGMINRAYIELGIIHER